MKKNISLLLIIIYLLPQNIQAQDNDEAVAIAVGGLLGIVAVEMMKEQMELRATEYVLNQFPQLNSFSLKTLDFNGKKLTDMSSTSVISFKLQEFKINKDGLDSETIFIKNMVLLAFTSYGWVNKNGVDFSKVHWHLINTDEWLNMMISYSKLASGEENENLIKKALLDGKIVKRGISAYNKKDDIDFYKMDGDMYLVTDYSDKFKFIYNEKSFGMYLKDTRDLVQIGSNDLIEIHNFLMEYRELNTVKIEQLNKRKKQLKELLHKGSISQEEYNEAKENLRKLLNVKE